MKVTERDIEQLWQNSAAGKTFHWNGTQIEIIYPGIPSHETGCDFEHAVFTLGNGRIVGRVEVHVRASQWYGHGHHHDPRYNGIDLHVVMYDDTGSVTGLQDGRIIPVISLENILSGSNQRASGKVEKRFGVNFLCPGSAKIRDAQSLHNIIYMEGMKRFLLKVDKFVGELATDQAEQVIYKYLARSLGYARNTEQFYRLTDILPFNSLSEFSAGSGLVAQAALLGTAGLLPFQRDGISSNPLFQSAVEMQEIWHDLAIDGAMKAGDWCFFRVRPGNHPVRRIIALSMLAGRYHRVGFIGGLGGFLKYPSITERITGLERDLVIAGDDYWQNHYDFGSCTRVRTALLGRSMAREMAVNVILPFYYSMGMVFGDSRLMEKALQTYGGYRSLQENQVLSYMKRRLSIGGELRLTAVEQQGFIHIFRNFCRYKKCRSCPVSVTPAPARELHPGRDRLFYPG